MKKKLITIQVELTAYVPADTDIEPITLDFDPSAIKIDGADGPIKGAHVNGYCTTAVFQESNELPYEDEEAEDDIKPDDWKRNLRAGDQVTWTDPDNGACFKTGIIAEIKYIGEDSASIIWRDGGETDVYLRELS